MKKTLLCLLIISLVLLACTDQVNKEDDSETDDQLPTQDPPITSQEKIKVAAPFYIGDSQYTKGQTIPIDKLFSCPYPVLVTYQDKLVEGEITIHEDYTTLTAWVDTDTHESNQTLVTFTITPTQEERSLVNVYGSASLESTILGQIPLKELPEKGVHHISLYQGNYLVMRAIDYQGQQGFVEIKGNYNYQLVEQASFVNHHINFIDQRIYLQNRWLDQGLILFDNKDSPMYDRLGMSSNLLDAKGLHLEINGWYRLTPNKKWLVLQHKDEETSYVTLYRLEDGELSFQKDYQFNTTSIDLASITDEGFIIKYYSSKVDPYTSPGSSTTTIEYVVKLDGDFTMAEQPRTIKEYQAYRHLNYQDPLELGWQDLEDLHYTKIAVYSDKGIDYWYEATYQGEEIYLAISDPEISIYRHQDIFVRSDDEIIHLNKVYPHYKIKALNEDTYLISYATTYQFVDKVPHKDFLYYPKKQLLLPFEGSLLYQEDLLFSYSSSPSQDHTSKIMVYELTEDWVKQISSFTFEGLGVSSYQVLQEAIAFQIALIPTGLEDAVGLCEKLTFNFESREFSKLPTITHSGQQTAYVAQSLGADTFLYQEEEVAYYENLRIFDHHEDKAFLWVSVTLQDGTKGYLPIYEPDLSKDPFLLTYQLQTDSGLVDTQIDKYVFQDFSPALLDRGFYLYQLALEQGRNIGYAVHKETGKESFIGKIKVFSPDDNLLLASDPRSLDTTVTFYELVDDAFMKLSSVDIELSSFHYEWLSPHHIQYSTYFEDDSSWKTIHHLKANLLKDERGWHHHYSFNLSRTLQDEALRQDYGLIEGKVYHVLTKEELIEHDKNVNRIQRDYIRYDGITGEVFTTEISYYSTEAKGELGHLDLLTSFMDYYPEVLALPENTLVTEEVLAQWQELGYSPEHEFHEKSPTGLSYEDLQ